MHTRTKLSYKPTRWHITHHPLKTINVVQFFSHAIVGQLTLGSIFQVNTITFLTLPLTRASQLKRFGDRRRILRVTNFPQVVL